jgi:opacity protein-like surface antigen
VSWRFNVPNSVFLLKSVAQRQHAKYFELHRGFQAGVQLSRDAEFIYCCHSSREISNRNGRLYVCRGTGMKRFGLTAFAALSLANSAYAADLQPVLKAPMVESMPSVSGYVELYSGWGSTKLTDPFGSDTADDGWVLGGAGRGTYWWSRNASIQLDAQAEGTSYKVPAGFAAGSHVSEHRYLIGVHANWRDSRYLWGVFGAAGDTTSGFNPFPTAAPSFRHGIIGAEGQAYLGPLTLYGQVGYDTSIGDPLAFGVDRISAWFARGTGRYYVNPNTRLEGTVLFASGRMDFVGSAPSTDFDVWLLRAKIEHKLAASPFSLFAAYEWSRNKFDAAGNFFGVKVEDQKFTVGARLYINENTLQWNDNKGTTLDIIDILKLPAAFTNSAIFPIPQ